MLYNRTNIQQNPRNVQPFGGMTKAQWRRFDMDSVTHKRCTRCGETKPIDEFYKPNPKTGKQECRCKSCMRERSLSWNRQNPDKAKQRMDKWHAEHKEWDAEYKRQYRKENPDRVREAKRAYRNANADKVRESKNRYRRENYEKNKASSLRWHEANIERVRDVGKRWREANRDKISQYYKDNRERYRAHRHNRRARIKGNGGRFTAQQWEELKLYYNYTCLCCGRREPEIKLEPDHVLAVIKGGSNSTDNIQPLCGSCNKKKHTKHIDYR